jgi:hypothetical protein
MTQHVFVETYSVDPGVVEQREQSDPFQAALSMVGCLITAGSASL